MTATRKIKEIILGNDVGDVTVSANGVRVEIRTDGNVKVRVVANDATKEPANSKDYEIGELYKGKGVYAGTWTPKDRDGKGLGKTFNLFAAPEDIGVLTTFNNAVAHVAGLKDWHGHNGFDHDVSGKTPDETLYDALRDGSYKGEWFIPTRDALNDNLYENKDMFKPENAFVTRFVRKAAFQSHYVSEFDKAPWYRSCTERANLLSDVWSQRFTDGHRLSDPKDDIAIKLSVRCVRAEPRP